MKARFGISEKTVLYSLTIIVYDLYRELVLANLACVIEK